MNVSKYILMSNTSHKISLRYELGPEIIFKTMDYVSNIGWQLDKQIRFFITLVPCHSISIFIDYIRGNAKHVGGQFGRP